MCLRTRYQQQLSCEFADNYEAIEIVDKLREKIKLEYVRITMIEQNSVHTLSPAKISGGTERFRLQPTLDQNHRVLIPSGVEQLVPQCHVLVIT